MRWTAEQVAALAPDPPALKAARALAGPGPWHGTGHGGEPPGVWGLCAGSGAEPYQVCVDLTEPAYRCTCPSRKFPCKHALALLLLWAGGTVPDGPPPDWVAQWHAARRERTGRAGSRSRGRDERPAGADEAARRGQARTAARRADRVGAGVAELERWLHDQVRHGLIGAGRAGYEHWDAMAARLVDAQAPGLASMVRRLAGVAGTPDRLLADLSLVHLLVAGYRRLDELPGPLAATVRGRVGFPVATDDVLAGPRTRDEWAVVGLRDEGDERLTVRRVWLFGARTGRPALVLSFAAPGQALPADLRVGTTVDADLCFYPGALALRALVAHRHGPATPSGEPTGALDVAGGLRRQADALRAEPWLDRWPMLLAGVTPVADRTGWWHLRDTAGAALPVDPGVGPPWRAVAMAGGAPATVAAEWRSGGLRPLTMWAQGRMARL
jgi:hypothetical protein